MQALDRKSKALPQGYYDALEFPLVAALFGRRARRFSLGATIPDGPLAYSSRHEPLPLSELERMMVLTAAAGNTGWHYMITRNAHYAPHLANYSAAAGGRTFPSAAGFHTSEVFFTDDKGVYLFLYLCTFPLWSTRGHLASTSGGVRASCSTKCSGTPMAT